MNFIVNSFIIWSKKVQKKTFGKGLIWRYGFDTIINVKLIIDLQNMPCMMVRGLNRHTRRIFSYESKAIN